MGTISAKYLNDHCAMCLECSGWLQPTHLARNDKHVFQIGTVYECGCGKSKLWTNSVRNENRLIWSVEGHPKLGKLDYFQGFCNDLFDGFKFDEVTVLKNGVRVPGQQQEADIVGNANVKVAYWFDRDDAEGQESSQKLLGWYLDHLDEVKALMKEPVTASSGAQPVKGVVVYHGTNEKFDKFDFDKSMASGGVWFSSSKDDIKDGTSGAAGTKYILKRTLTLNKPAGWDEYDKFMIDQLVNDGYDGVVLPSGSITHYIAFYPECIGMPGEVPTGHAREARSPMANKTCKTVEELQAMDTEELDRMAFGVANGEVIDLDPSQINIQYKSDLENPKDNFARMGTRWLKSVDFSEPVDVEIHDDGKYYLADGHHRWFAASKLGKKLPCRVTVKANPVRFLTEGPRTVRAASVGAACNRLMRKPVKAEARRAVSAADVGVERPSYGGFLDNGAAALRRQFASSVDNELENLRHEHDEEVELEDEHEVTRDGPSEAEVLELAGEEAKAFDEKAWEQLIIHLPPMFAEQRGVDLTDEIMKEAVALAERFWTEDGAYACYMPAIGHGIGIEDIWGSIAREEDFDLEPLWDAMSPWLSGVAHNLENAIYSGAMQYISENRTDSSEPVPRGPEHDKVVYRYAGTNSTIGGASAKGMYVAELPLDCLRDESKEMGHCIGNKANGHPQLLKAGTTRVFSIRTEAGKTKFTIEYFIKDGVHPQLGRVRAGTVTEVKGNSNRLPGFLPRGHEMKKPDDVRLVVDFLMSYLKQTPEQIEKTNDIRAGVLALKATGVDPFSPPPVSKKRPTSGEVAAKLLAASAEYAIDDFYRSEGTMPLVASSAGGGSRHVTKAISLLREAACLLEGD